MKVLFCHPSGLMYTEIFLRLEPLGRRAVRRGGAARRPPGAPARSAGGVAGRLPARDRHLAPRRGRRSASTTWPTSPRSSTSRARRAGGCRTCCSSSAATAPRSPPSEILEHAGGAIDCVVRGEGEEITPRLLDAAAHDRAALHTLPGVVTAAGEGPPPEQVRDLNALMPARDLLPRRRKYFIGVLDPAASIEMTRGCPWDCSFCSAWTFYGRSYRRLDPVRIADELARIEEPGVFIVDDVAFIQAEHGFAIGRELERRRIRKRYYLETRGDVLLRNKEVFRYWRRLGPRLHVHRRRGGRPGGAGAAPQAREAVDQLRGARLRALAGDDGRDQHHRRPRLGRRPLSRHPRVGAVGAGDRQHQRQHALPRHRDVPRPGAQPGDARLPAVRHPARGAADAHCRSTSSTRSWCTRSGC